MIIINKLNELIGTGATISYSIEEKLNKYEVGPTGNRFTIYYEDIADLERQLKELKDKGILKE